MATLPGICVLAIAAANLAAGVSVEHPWTKPGYGGPTPFRDGAYNGKDPLLLVTCGLFSVASGSFPPPLEPQGPSHS